MSVAETSLEAFYTNDLEGDQKKVMKLIERFGPITIEETSKRLGKYPNQISGRFTELKEKNKIEVIGHTQNQRGNTVRRYDIK